MTINTQPVSIEYSRETHGFFPELVRLVLALCGTQMGFSAHQHGSVRGYTLNELLTIEGIPHVSGMEMGFFPAPLFQAFLNPSEGSPRVIRITKKPLNPTPPNHALVLTNTRPILSRLIGDAFLSYVEKHRESVFQRWRKDQSKWPSQVWRFGWVIRNACAHNGRIRFTNAESPPVSWRGLTYRPGDSKEIFFSDITGVELILLMEEMDEELRKF